MHIVVVFIGVRSHLKQKNIDNISKAEEQAAQQNYDVRDCSISLFVQFKLVNYVDPCRWYYHCFHQNLPSYSLVTNSLSNK